MPLLGQHVIGGTRWASPGQAAELVGCPIARVETWGRLGRVRRMLIPRPGTVRPTVLVAVDDVMAVASRVK